MTKKAENAVEKPHELTNEMKSNIRQMLLSKDETDKKMAINILNNCNIKDKNTQSLMIDLILDTDLGLSLGIRAEKYLVLETN